MSTRIARLCAASILVGVILTPSVAGAGGCQLFFNPNPGWRGAIVTVSGQGLTANDTYYVNVDGNQIGSGPTDDNGAFLFQWSIPGNHPTGSLNTFMQDNPASCSFNGSYTVNPSPPTTTTSSTTTTTTTLAPTTTEAPTTTLAATTTEAPTTTLATTTSLTEDTTTTTEADSGGGGGVDTIVIVLIALVVLLGLGLAFALGRRRRS
jgi:MYXO-CTERM domain-containing protein